MAAPVDAASLGRSLQQVIWSGGYVGTVGAAARDLTAQRPAIPDRQALLGDAAAAYIADHLGGRANVVLLTHDSLPFLAPRFVAMRDSLAKLPGVTIVADISPPTVNKEGGNATMSTILLAEPDIDVVLGADTVVLGALEALREAGKERPDQFLGGIDGEPEAVAEIKAGGPYKASVSLNSPVFGYAMGQHAAYWLEGKSIPQAMGHPSPGPHSRQHCIVRSRSCRPGRRLRRPRAPRLVSEDVRQYLLRYSRSIREFCVVVRARTVTFERRARTAARH